MPGELPIVAVITAAGEPRPEGLEGLDGLVEVRTVGDAASLGSALDDGAQVLGVWDFNTTLVRDLWPRAGSVRWVHAASAGVDAVLFPEVVAAGVTVTNTRGLFDRGIAEFVLLALLAFAKDLPTTLEQQRRREWRHRDSEALEGRRLLVVGAGSIGRAVARLARAVGLHVDGVARRGRPDDADFEEVAGTEDLHRMLADADDVVITAPLTPETTRLFDDDAFAAMRRGARLINVGRGGIVDEPALLRALDSGQIGAAALDVFADEPLPPDNALWGRANVIVSPHQAGDVHGWRRSLGELFVANVRRHLADEPLHNVVHPPAEVTAR